MQLQTHIELFEGLDADIYALSNDSPQQHKKLNEKFQFTYPFLSDPAMKLIEKADLEDQAVSKRGYSIFDKNGEFVTSEHNDYWGDEIEQTAKKIKKALP